jgi:hypothetical protein
VARRVIELALIDSGAARSVFPLAVARELGIEHELVEDAARSVGVEGAGFPTWSYPPGLTCHVLRTAPDGPSGREPWGEPVRLTPAFADKRVFLLGREDFFRGFRILFDPAGPQFVLAQ